MIRSISEGLRWYKRWKTLPVYPWINAAQAYRRKEFEKAEQLYARGFANHHRHPAALHATLDLAFCKFKLRKVRESESMLRALIEENPEHREAWCRLSKLLLWMGRPFSCVQLLKSAREKFPTDQELWGLHLFALTELGAVAMSEARILMAGQGIEHANHPITKVALARLEALTGDIQNPRLALTKLCAQPEAPLEALHAVAELLLSDQSISMAKHFLRRALSMSPDNPKTLSLLAQTYLVAEEGGTSAVQLAQKSCQLVQWLSPQFLHILVRAHLQEGDKVSALLIASKAQEITDELYPDRPRLDELVIKLSNASLA